MRGVAITRRDWLWLLVPAGCFFLFLEGIENRFFLRDDNALYYLPAYVHNLRAVVQDHQLAFINLFQNRGMEHLGAGQSATLYPPVYLATWAAQAAGDVRWAVDLLAIAHLLVAGCAMYVLLRRFEMRFGAWAGALFLATSPFLVVGARGWVILAFAAAYSLSSLVLLVRFLDRPSWGCALALAVVQTLFFFCGYPQLFLYSGLFQGLFLAIALSCAWLGGTAGPRRIRRTLGRLAAAAGMTALWCLPLLLPMLATLSQSRRGSGVASGEFVQYALQPDVFARAQIFAFDQHSILGASSALFHVGIPALLALCAVFLPGHVPAGSSRSLLPQRSLIRIFAVTAGLAWLASTQVWGLVYGVPLLSLFRWPFKSFLFFVLFLIPPAAWSLERLAAFRRPLAYAAVFVVLGGNVAVLANDSARASFGFATVAAPVEVAEDSPLGRVQGSSQRFASFFAPERPLAPAAASHLVTEMRYYNLATLFGQRPQFSGYDSLLSDDAFMHSLGSRHGYLTPSQISPATLRYLGAWGVEILLAQQNTSLREKLLGSDLVEPMFTHRGVHVFALKSHRPIVEDLPSGSAIPFRPRVNGLDFEVQSSGTAVRVAVERLEGWTWTLDDAVQGPPAEHPAGGWVLGVPPGIHQIRLAYVSPGFEMGVWLALGGSAALMLVVLLRRRKEKLA